MAKVIKLDRTVTGEASSDDAPYDAALRPRNFDEYIGQNIVKENLRVMVKAAQKRGSHLDHLLFAGPPGLGKTSLSNIIATELGVDMKVTSAPMLAKKADLVGILTGLNDGDVLFIDEIHRLPMVVEESLYVPMEDYRFDLTIGQGAAARTTSVPLPKFTLVGATTRAGMLSAPLRDRFGYIGRLDFYTVEELAKIAYASARKLGVVMDTDGAIEVAQRSRGTPRLANRLIRRLRDFADVYGDGSITAEVASKGLDQLQVDKNGFDEMDRRLIDTIVNRFGGGPVGLETLAATIGEESDTIEGMIEPYLLKEGFLQKTSRGRMAGPRAMEYLKK